MKTMQTLYIDLDSKLKAKQLGINMSRAFNEFLNSKIEAKESTLNPEQLIANLRSQLAIAKAQLEKARDELSKLQKDMKRGWRRTGEKITWN